MEQLDQQHERIQDDLRGLIAGEVRCDDVFLQLFAGDGSIYEIKPLGVVRPRNTADVVACVQYAAEKQIPIHARGAGTGVAAGSLGPGLVLDFSRYLHRVLRMETETVRVQPGLVHERLNAQLKRRGRVFGPDPANTNSSTVGGLIAVDGAGSRWLKYGSTKRHVKSLQVVLADGRVMEAGREPLVDGISHDSNPLKRDLIDRLARLLGDRDELIRRKQPQSPVNRCGYHVADILGEGYLDLAGLLVGSEGTLALICEATLATQPLPRYRGVMLLLFDSLDKAARAVLEILPHGPSACDLLDRRYLSLARELEVRFDLLIPSRTEAVLLVEHCGENPREVRSRIQHMADRIEHRKRLAFGSRQTFDESEMELFRQLAVRIHPALGRLAGATQPVPVVEDIAVPPRALPEMLVKTQNVLKRYEVTAAVSCHAGQGQLHIQPFLDLGSARDVQKMRSLATDLYEEVFLLGGTISGEHGCGLSRTQFVRQQYGELVDVFEEIKRIFDPENLLNPGKITGGDPHQLTRQLRPVVSVPEISVEPAAEGEEPSELRDLVELQLNWEPGRVAGPARRCNGCGDCRTQSPDERMCPMFRVLPAEEASPRAKANLIRAVLTGRMDLSSLTSDEFKAVADLCFNCHMCTTECPARVDIPRLIIQGKGAYVTAKGLRLTDAVMTRLDLLSALAGITPTVSNWALGNRPMRWLIEKLLGIAQGRKLPRLASRNFIRRAAKRRLTKPRRHTERKIAYFVDTYAHYHDPQLAEALVAVLKHNAVAVYVPPDQKQAGTAAICAGSLDRARRLAEHNTAVLAEAVRQGYHVVATEPAAVVSLTREYLDLLDNDDVRLVAENTSEACDYLWKMHTMGKLQLDLKPINATVGYHMPCRLKTLGIGSPGENLLRLIPGLSVRRLEEGCSGMAGTFGLKRENYRTSLRIGRGLISSLREPTLQAGTTECSACKIQMEQGTTKPTIHPVKLLARAYGLMPELDTLLTTPSEELIVT